MNISFDDLLVMNNENEPNVTEPVPTGPNIAVDIGEACRCYVAGGIGLDEDGSCVLPDGSILEPIHPEPIEGDVRYAYDNTGTPPLPVFAEQHSPQMPAAQTPYEYRDTIALSMHDQMIDDVGKRVTLYCEAGGQIIELTGVLTEVGTDYFSLRDSATGELVKGTLSHVRLVRVLN